MSFNDFIILAAEKRFAKVINEIHINDITRILEWFDVKSMRHS